MTNILENTIRDGSYVVDFQFSIEQSNSIVSGLANLGFEFIEIGHGLGLGANRHPSISSAKETDAVYITGAKKVAGNSKIGTFFIPGIGELDDIRYAKDCGIDFIRIGANVNQYRQVREAAQLYAETFDHATRLYITEVHAEPEGDVSFPAFDVSRWREVSRERHEAGEKDSAAYSFVLYEKRD